MILLLSAIFGSVISLVIPTVVVALVVASCEYVAASGFPSILVGSMITMGVAFNGWGTVAACRVEVLRVAHFAAILHCSPGMCRLRCDRLARFIPLYQSIVACCYRILGCRVLVAPQGLRCRELYRPSWICWGIGVPFLFGGADRARTSASLSVLSPSSSVSSPACVSCRANCRS